MAAMLHAMPIPRKTFTALLPVTLPTLASAYLSWQAATLLANVSAIKSYAQIFLLFSFYFSPVLPFNLFFHILQFIDFQRFPLTQTTQYGAQAVVFTLICRGYREQGGGDAETCVVCRNETRRSSWHTAICGKILTQLNYKSLTTVSCSFRYRISFERRIIAIATYLVVHEISEQFQKYFTNYYMCYTRHFQISVAL